MKKLSKNQGFTLIEITIAIVILGMMVVLIGEMYMRGTISSKTEMNRAKLQTDVRNTMEGITNNIKLSSKIDSAYGGYTGGATILILELPAIDGSNNFLYSGNSKVHDYIIYSLDNKDLHKLVFSSDTRSRLYSQNNSDKIILSNVKTLNFSYEPALPGSIIVKTDLTVNDTTQKVAQEASVSAEAKRRNSD